LKGEGAEKKLSNRNLGVNPLIATKVSSEGGEAQMAQKTAPPNVFAQLAQKTALPTVAPTLPTVAPTLMVADTEVVVVIAADNNTVRRLSEVDFKKNEANLDGLKFAI
jgi:hypothetical protein